MELSTRQNAPTETPSGSVVKVNGNYLKLKAGYLFPEIGRRVKAFSAAHPEAAFNSARDRRRHRAAPSGLSRSDENGHRRDGHR